VGLIEVEGDVDGLSDRLMDGTFVLSGEIVIFTVGCGDTIVGSSLGLELG
jgi:hypothetical protein